MQFCFEERRAIYRIARVMVIADGKVADSEAGALQGEMLRLGSTPDELIEFRNTIQSYESAEALSVIDGFDEEKKRYFCALLGALLVVDGALSESEVKLWAFTSAICGLPPMSVGEALETVSNL